MWLFSFPRQHFQNPASDNTRAPNRCGPAIRILILRWRVLRRSCQPAFRGREAVQVPASRISRPCRAGRRSFGSNDPANEHRNGDVVRIESQGFVCVLIHFLEVLGPVFGGAQERINGLGIRANRIFLDEGFAQVVTSLSVFSGFSLSRRLCNWLLRCGPFGRRRRRGNPQVQ